MSIPAAPPTAGAASRATDALDALRSGWRDRPRSMPLSTGFDPLDEILRGGFGAGDLVVLGGRPGGGKTTMALQWARHLAKVGGTAVFACYEHDRTTMLIRLLLIELGDLAAAGASDDELRVDALRDRLRRLGTGDETPEDLLRSDPLLLEAESRVRAYGDRLLLVPASGTRTDLAALRQLVDDCPAGSTALFVDYLQKVPVPVHATDEAERVTRVAEGLKELALLRGIAVVAITATDRAGLRDRRLHLHHFRGSAALAYEADVVLVLNDKLRIVSRVHLAYDTTLAYTFREQVVLSIEKHRAGLADVHLEFRKDFANARFDPRGQWVAERLWDEGSPEE